MSDHYNQSEDRLTGIENELLTIRWDIFGLCEERPNDENYKS